MGRLNVGKTLSGLVLAALVAGWAALFFSGRGLLVWFITPEGSAGMLECRYFTGTGVVQRKFLYTQGGLLGRDTCPRFVELD